MARPVTLEMHAGGVTVNELGSFNDDDDERGYVSLVSSRTVSVLSHLCHYLC